MHPMNNKFCRKICLFLQNSTFFKGKISTHLSQNPEGIDGLLDAESPKIHSILLASTKQQTKHTGMQLYDKPLVPAKKHTIVKKVTLPKE